MSIWSGKKKIREFGRIGLKKDRQKLTKCRPLVGGGPRMHSDWLKSFSFDYFRIKSFD